MGRYMGRKRNVLSVAGIRSLNRQGKYSDGGGLYLQVSNWGTKSWIFRYQLNGRKRDMGLGSLMDLTLKEARKKAQVCRIQVSDGVDPIGSRKSQKSEAARLNGWTFDGCAYNYIQAHSPKWKNPKHLQQWQNTLASYVSPVFGELPVSEVGISHIMQAIEPIWISKTETASRVRGRIEKVLAWAIVNKYRDQPNPALWKNNLDQLLPSKNKISKPEHFAALPRSEISALMVQLSGHSSVSAKALRFLIYTALRTGEVIQASWDQIDLNNQIWTIPADVMKSEREHRVPLSGSAISVLESLPKIDNWLFPSSISGKHIGNAAMSKVLKKTLNRLDMTVHGFRSTFKDWASEVSSHKGEVSEAALAHKLKDKTEAAYQRGDYFEMRRTLMEDWSNFIDEKG